MTKQRPANLLKKQQKRREQKLKPKLAKINLIMQIIQESFDMVPTA